MQLRDCRTIPTEVQTDAIEEENLNDTKHWL